MSNSAKKTLLSIINAKMDELSPEKAFLIDLQNTVSKMNVPKKGSIFYKPSSMNCERCMYYIRRGIDVDEFLPTYSSVRITECGSSSHERIQYYVSQMRDKGFDCDWIDPEWYIKNKNLNYLRVQDEEFCKEMGLEYHGKKDYETKLFDTRYNLSFLCDGIIRYRGEYYILEIKTETGYKNGSRTEADKKHRAQAICYSLALGINKIMWIYEGRNVCDAKTFITEISEEEKTEMALKIEYVDDCVKNLIIPNKCSDLENCKYCSYKETCRRDG